MLDPNQVILAHLEKLWIPPEGEGEPAQQGKALKTLSGLSCQEEGRKHEH